MIYGIGIDLVELNHLDAACKKSDKLCPYILTPVEKEVYDSYSTRRQLEYLAGRFAAKEAYSKALGTGIGKTVNFQMLEITSDKYGKPYFSNHPFEGKAHLSITHTEDYCMAQVILEKNKTSLKVEL